MMAWFDEFNLPGCTVTGHFGFVRADGPDADDRPDVTLASGRITFTPTASAVQADGAWLGISPVPAEIFEGQIVMSEEDPRPVRLLSTEAQTNVPGWGWVAAFEVRGASIPKVKFAAPATGVHLTDGTVPITGQPVEMIVGKPGPAGPSAYDLYRASTTDDPPMSEAEWLESLKGQDGDGVLPAGVIPIFPTLAEAQAWEAANPGRAALTIEPQTPDVTPPVAGTLGVVVSDISATLTVTGASDDRAISGYSFRRGTGAWSEWQVGAAFTMGGLTPATSYDFQHKVRDGAGNETLGAAVTRTTAAMAAKTPAQIGNLWGHWDASAAGSLTTAGTAVSAWRGVTANARELAQATSSKQPTTATINGKAAVKFDRASTSSLRNSFSGTISASAGYSVCAILRFDDSDTTVSQVFTSLAAGARLGRGVGGLIRNTAAPTIDGPVTVKPVAGDIVLVAATYKSGGPSSLRINGITGTVNSGALTDPSTALAVGCNVTGEVEHASVTVAEVWVHDRPIQASEIDALRMYAQAKWGAQ